MRAALLSLVCLAACSRDGRLVVVTLDHAPLGIVTLQGKGSVGSQARTFSLIVAPDKPSYVFGFELAPGLSGVFQLHVEALAADRTLLAQGDGQVSIEEGTMTIDIDLGAAQPDLAEPDFTPPPDLAHCQTSAECPADAPICGVSGCGPCAIDGGAGYTDECAAHAAVTPLCNAGLCVGCTTHAECPAGICAEDGSCVPKAQIAYVDGTMCGGAMDGSSPLDAYCQISDAIGAASPKPYIHAAGTAYTAITVDHTVTIVGPGVGNIPNYATLNGMVAVTLSSASAATLTLDGISVIGQAKCVGGAAQKLRILDSQVSSTVSPLYGVDSGGCTLDLISTIVVGNAGGGVRLGTGTARIIGSQLVSNNKVSGQVDTGYGLFENSPGNVFIDRSDFGNNATGGVWLYNATYTLINSFISNNDVGATLGTAGVFRYNTVHDNTTMGVSCPNGAVAIESSIVWHNPMGGTQLSGSCTPDKIVVGAEVAAGAGKIKLDPDFGPNFRLQDNAANQACCIDQGPLTSGTPPDHDHDGNKRPQGAGPDIGAHELK